MSLQNWGQMQKSQEDSETIEEAIERIIEEHNDDPTAHLGEGQSLEEHKKDETIDHPEESIVEDKYAKGSMPFSALSDKELQLFLDFQGDDGWIFDQAIGTGSFQTAIGGAAVNMSGSTEAEVAAFFGSTGPNLNRFDNTKDFYFKTMAKVINIGSGRYGHIGPCFAEVGATFRGFAIQFSNSVVKLVVQGTSNSWANRQEWTIPDIEGENIHTYEVFYFAADGSFMVKVDGAIVLNATPDPAVGSWDDMMNIHAYKDTGSGGNIQFGPILISRKL